MIDLADVVMYAPEFVTLTVRHFWGREQAGVGSGYDPGKGPPVRDSLWMCSV